MMVGREVENVYPQIQNHRDREVFRVENLCKHNVFDKINFSLREGEILGFSGMMGAGRSEIMRAIFGIDKYDSGKIYLNGKEILIKNPHDAVRAGIGMVTEDRATYGFVGTMSVKDNVTLPNGDLYSKYGFLKKNYICQEVNKISAKLAIRIPDIYELVANLSGGNQQKVVLAKWLVRNIKLLIIDEPTRGIDIGAKQEIYKLIQQLALAGLSIIVVSSEMQEVIGISHRILVINEGRIIREFSHDNVDQNTIMRTIVEGGHRI